MHVFIFLGGAVAALLVSTLTKTKTVHNLAVKGVVGGIRVKEEVLRKIEAIQEDVVDVYEEARRKPAEPEA